MTTVRKTITLTDQQDGWIKAQIFGPATNVNRLKVMFIHQSINALLNGTHFTVMLLSSNNRLPPYLNTSKWW